MTYDDWGKSIPDVITDDIFRTDTAYRLSFYLGDILQCDVRKIFDAVREEGEACGVKAWKTGDVPGDEVPVTA